MGYLRKYLTKKSAEIRKKLQQKKLKLEFNFPKYKIDLDKKIPDTIVLGKGTKNQETIDFRRAKGWIINEIKKRVDIEAFIRKKFEEKVQQLKEQAPEYLAKNLAIIERDYNNIKVKLLKAQEVLQRIKEGILQVLTVINKVREALSIMDKICQAINTVLAPIRTIIEIAEKLLYSPIFLGEPGALRVNLQLKVQTLKSKINSTVQEIYNLTHPAKLMLVLKLIRTIEEIINNILDDINFLLEKIQMLLSILEYLYMLILRVIAMRETENITQIGDDTVIRDEIEDANTPEELLEILVSINPNTVVNINNPNRPIDPDAFNRIITKIKDSRNRLIGYKTGMGKPGQVTFMNKNATTQGPKGIFWKEKKFGPEKRSLRKPYNKSKWWSNEKEDTPSST
jgi:hypothetical protein